MKSIILYWLVVVPLVLGVVIFILYSNTMSEVEKNNERVSGIVDSMIIKNKEYTDSLAGVNAETGH